ncbi:MAG: M24 family metallopeptidase [Ktedonobacteraceae bacterium]
MYPSFSEAEFSRRYTTVRAAMRDADLSALLIYNTPSSYNEVLYLSNFITTRESFLVFPTEGEPTLFIQMFNHVPNARKVANIPDVHWGGPDSAAIVAENLRARGLENSRIGLVGPISFKHYDVLRRTLQHITLLDFTPQFLHLRLIKSEEEIEFLRIGAQFSDLAIKALEQQARPGITENDLAAIVEGAYLHLGGKNHIHYMGTTSMSNPDLCVPAQLQSNRILQAGDVLITEISAHYHGYTGQILRPFAIGSPPSSAYMRMYEVAVEAFNRIADVIRPGATSEEVLDAADYIHQAGFTICDDLLHGFGGGYLRPILRTRRTSARPAETFVFRENMVIVIQPNVITEDERMGIQVGEMMRIKPGGIESLHRYPMRFIQCTGQGYSHR